MTLLTPFPFCATCGNADRPQHVHLGGPIEQDALASAVIRGAGDGLPRRGGRRSKNAGYRAEKMVERRLSGHGFTRMPLSGALGGRWSGDLRRDVLDHKRVKVVEVKRRVGKQTQLRRWLLQGGADLLVVDTGGGAEPLAVLDLSTLEAVLSEAGYVPNSRRAESGGET